MTIAALSPRGRFITLEGGEGVGKSTQAARLAEALRARGHEVVLTREPGGSPGAEAIRALLLEGAGDRWTAEAEALLFAAARADHVAHTIRPALERGAWVVCDRFVDSSRAYQGGADGVGDEKVMQLHEIGSGGLLPDRTLVLTLDPSKALPRATAREDGKLDRIGGRSKLFHDLVFGRFTRLGIGSNRLRLVDAWGTVDEVAAVIWHMVEDLL